MNKIVRTFTLAVAVATLLSAATRADAALKMRLVTGAHTIEVTDTDGDGVVAFVGSLGNFAMNITGGFSKPTLAEASMDLLSGNITGLQGGGTLTIDLVDTGFASFPEQKYLLTEVGGTIFGGSGNNVRFNSWVDMLNSGQYATGSITTGTVGPFYAPGAFAGSESVHVGAASGPYAMAIQSVIVLGGTQQMVSFDAHSRVVPEPFSSTIWIGTIIGSFVGARAFRKRRVQ